MELIVLRVCELALRRAVLFAPLIRLRVSCGLQLIKKLRTGLKREFVPQCLVATYDTAKQAATCLEQRLRLKFDTMCRKSQTEGAVLNNDAVKLKT